MSKYTWPHAPLVAKLSPEDAEAFAPHLPDGGPVLEQILISEPSISELTAIHQTLVTKEENPALEIHSCLKTADRKNAISYATIGKIPASAMLPILDAVSSVLVPYLNSFAEERPGKPQPKSSGKKTGAKP